jgi:hypothetical protein
MPDSNSFNDVANYLKDNPTLLTSLLAGAGSGLAGGLISAARPALAGEDRSARRKRVLKNALISALSGGAATGLGMKAYETLSTAHPEAGKGFFAGLFDTANTFGVPAASAGGAYYVGNKIGERLDASTLAAKNKAVEVLGKAGVPLSAKSLENYRLTRAHTPNWAPVTVKGNLMRKALGNTYQKGLSTRAGGAALLLSLPSILSDLARGAGLTD